LLVRGVGVGDGGEGGIGGIGGGVVETEFVEKVPLFS
jgi:hypothetical protein